MNLNTNKIIKRIAIALTVIGFGIFTVAFAMNGFSFKGFENENREWYQIVISD